MNFTPNRNFLDELTRQAGPKRVLGEKAREALTAARFIAAGQRSTGDYQRSLKAEENRLLSTDPAAHLIEWGSRNNPPQAVLRKAVEQVGARYVDTGR